MLVASLCLKVMVTMALQFGRTSTSLLSKPHSITYHYIELVLFAQLIHKVFDICRIKLI